jgi:anaerobic selenocysteine-containing dehydrogenase
MEIHPATAEKLGIREGDWVVIENMFGKAKERAQFSPGIDPRVVHAQHGWWYPEKPAAEPSLFGVWESNINTLIPHKHIGKLGFGGPFKSILCKVYRAEDQNFYKQN